MTENRPSTFYFPNANNRDECAAECQLVSECYAYAFVGASFVYAAWAGQCYGISKDNVNHVEENGVFSGKRRPCAICWDRRDNTNAVGGRITGGPRSHQPPNYYYFSQAGDREACQAACENEPDCYAYAYITPEFGDSSWAGLCYGIMESLARPKTASKNNIHSGYKVPCPAQ